MEQMTSNASEVRDRVQLPFHFDVPKMQAEVVAFSANDYVYYDAIPLTAPAHMVDPSIPPPGPADDYADGSWTPWLETNALKKSPYLTSIVDHFRQHTKVTLVRVLRLAPGGTVKEHTDPTLGLEVEKSVVRLTIPIDVNDSVDFFLNDTVVPMKEGECWYLRLTDPHRVVNAGSTDRINMTIDMIPNEWLRSLILES